MKNAFFCSMLLAASLMISCSLTSPIRADLAARDDVTDCITGPSCVAAANAWNDCSTKWKAGKIQSLKPIASSRPADYLVRQCLCNYNTTIPSYHLWSEDLNACTYCIDEARGFLNSNQTATGRLGLLLGTPESFIGFCKEHPHISYNEFVTKARTLGESVNFPICLPDALPYSNYEASRGIESRNTMPVPSVGSSFTISRSILTSATATLKPHPTGMRCNRDNCLRQCVRESAKVALFCATYTKSPNQATTGLPTFVSQCSNSPSRISSACSCLETISKVSITSTALGQFSSVLPSSHINSIPSLTNPHSSTSSSHLRTVYSTQWITITLNQSGTNTKLSTSAKLSLSPIISLTSTFSSFSVELTTTKTVHSTVLSTIVVSAPASTTPKNSLTLATSTLFSSIPKVTSPSTTSLNPISTAKVVSLVTTSPSAAVPTWSTFPPSIAMKSCMTMNTCINAHNIYGNCSTLPTGLRIRNCLCESYSPIWIDNLSACASCISKALPAGKYTADLPAYVKNGTTALCSSMDTYSQSLIQYRFLELGDYLTSYFQSPIYMFNITWLAAPFIFNTNAYPELNPKSMTFVTSGFSTRTIWSSTVFLTPTPSSHAAINTAASELSNER